MCHTLQVITVWKVPKYEVFRGLSFLVLCLYTEAVLTFSLFSTKIGKYRPEQALNFDFFQVKLF